MASPAKAWKGVMIYNVTFLTNKLTTLNRYFIFDDHLKLTEIELTIYKNFPQIKSIKLIEEWQHGLSLID